MKKGRITLPADNMPIEEIKEIIEKWGTDAIRDSDGTELPEGVQDLNSKIYGKYFVTRGDNEWAKANPEDIQHTFLISDYTLATDSTLKINPMESFFDRQFKVDYESCPKKYWEVIDRTTGELTENWHIDEDGMVVIENTVPMHEYTVSFLARNMWDPTHMHNVLTNNWTEDPHIDYSPYYPKTYDYIMNRFSKWCEDNPEINVVRFTTFLYHFTILNGSDGKEKYFDWFGYSHAVSPKMIDDFEAEYGYRLRAEDFVDAGRYNTPFKVPSKAYLDYMDFVERFVSKVSGELVEIAHKNGKEAMMFLGDNWIGAEPYGEHFKDINLDAVVGSVSSGLTVRMLSDIPNIKYSEGRFMPYFFPDTFYEGNDPVPELNNGWRTARRAIMRKPLDRIGYGGYLSLVTKFPKFVERVGEICEEFRTIYDMIDNKKPHTALKVAILNAWGKKRSWMSHLVAHDCCYPELAAYQGVAESLSGLPVDVCFISFDDIKDGVPSDIDVIINVGDAGTAYSGGENWLNEKILESVRKFIHNGGGFIGVGQPTAVHGNGKFFQLSDALGVEQETGLSMSVFKYNNTPVSNHFILEDAEGEIDYGQGTKNVYASKSADVLDVKFDFMPIRGMNFGQVKMAVNEYGKGRCAYLTGLPYNPVNSRILYRAMLWTAGKECEIKKAFSTNVNTECNYYPNSNKYAVVNNSDEAQETTFYDINGNETKLTLEPMEIKWL